MGEQRKPGDPVGITYESRLSRSARLAATAGRLIRTDRTMLALAAASALFGLLAGAVLFHFGGYLDGHPSRGRLMLATLIAAWPMTFVSVFLGVALAAAADAALVGRPRLSLGEALAVSRRRAGQIALWSLLAAGVGQLLSYIADKLPFAGRLTAWALGGAWSLLTIFAIPVLAIEGCTAPQCVRRSAALMRERWGEGVAGTLVIVSAFTAVLVAACMVLGVAFGAAGAGGTVVMVVTGALIFVVLSAMTTTQGVFAVALYRYAADGAVTGGFPKDDLEAPFTKRRRRLFRRR